MALATCKNPECARVLDVPEIPRSWRTLDGRCVGCAGVNPESLMQIPASVVNALKSKNNAPLKLERVPAPTLGRGGRVAKSAAMPFDLLKAPGDDGLVDSFLVPYNGEAPQTVAHRVAKRLDYWKRTHPGHGKIITRRSDAENGVRVYRVE